MPTDEIAIVAAAIADTAISLPDLIFIKILDHP